MLDDCPALVDAEFEAGKSYKPKDVLEFMAYYYSGFSTNPTPSKPRPPKPVAVT